MSAMRIGVLLCLLLLAAGCQLTNHAPDVPAAPTGPTLVFVNSWATYVSSTTDPDGDSVSLNLLCTPSDATPGAGPYWSEQAGSGDTVSMRMYYSVCGTYKVWMRARDEHGRKSDWSQPLAVTCMPESARTD